MALPFRADDRARGRAADLANPDGAPASERRQPLGARPAAATWPPLRRQRAGETDGAPGAAAALPATRACEAALLDDLLALLAALRLPLDALPERPVSAAALGGALAELERAERGGSLAIAAAEARRRRLLALSGAAAKLGALLDQRRRGLLPDPALHDRRSAVLARLAPFFSDETRDGCR